MAGRRPIIDLEPREDTGRHRRPVRPRPPAPAAPPPAPERARRVDAGLWAAWALAAAWAGVLAWLSVARHRAFATGRFDLGNMVQAVWSTAQGRVLDTTDVSGVQFVRLGAHVDPVLVLFTPLWWLWSSPESLLVAQALIVATGAVPAFLLGRRWLGDDRLALAGAAAYLLLPGMLSAVLFDFHPVTLAAPLLMFCVWAAEQARWWTLGACAALAALSQEQVGLLVAGIALWMAVRHPARRRAAAILGAASVAWVAIALAVVMPAFALAGNPQMRRYEELGDGPLDILVGFLTRPWEAAGVLATPGRAAYLAILLAPLLALPLLAPALAAAALPQLLINLFAREGPPQGVAYHYAVLLVPVLVAAAMLGLARLRARERPAPLVRLARRSGAMAALLTAAVLAAAVALGPLPGWGAGGLHAFTVDERARALARAVALVPPDAAVSASNAPGAHLSERRRIYLFPRIGDAGWVVVDGTARARAAAAQRPTLFPPGTILQDRILARSSRWALVFDEADVRVYRRLGPAAPTVPSPLAPPARR